LTLKNVHPCRNFKPVLPKKSSRTGEKRFHSEHSAPSVDLPRKAFEMKEPLS